MDNNEQIVRTWLESKGFLVQSRIKYKAHSGENAGWSDIDLIAYNPSENKKVAVDVTAWITEKIRFSYVINPTSGTYKRLHKINSSQARSTIRKLFNAQNDNEYEIWHVVSFISMHKEIK